MYIIKFIFVSLDSTQSALSLDDEEFSVLSTARYRHWRADYLNAVKSTQNYRCYKCLLLKICNN